MLLMKISCLVCSVYWKCYIWLYKKRVKVEKFIARDYLNLAEKIVREDIKFSDRVYAKMLGMTLSEYKDCFMIRASHILREIELDKKRIENMQLEEKEWKEFASRKSSSRRENR